MTTAAYSSLLAHTRRTATLGSIDALVSWDQETYLPPSGAAFRAEQMSLLAELTHTARTDNRVGEWLSACESDAALKPDPLAQANLRELRRDFDRATKLPTELVAEMAKVGSQSQEAWKHARANNDFKHFEPWLEKMFALMRKKAECYGWAAGGEVYDALLGEYEPGASAKEIEAVFTPLRGRLANLVARYAGAKNKPSDAVLSKLIPADKQHAFGQAVLKAIGFDFQAGRLDTTAHPFCSGMAPGDTRLTTRYRDEHFSDALYGSMHEAGHGMYEQGLPKDKYFGQPIADSISLGIHESQSRMWENFVGRSREFWVFALPLARQHFGDALPQTTVDELYRAVNTAKPSLIRVEADEATYNLHVMIRFELERALLRGDLKVKDLPGEWNKRYKDYLGIDVPSDAKGCMQDVHWSFGLVGYFPTYTLGNLYAGQFWEKINKDIPDLSSRMEKGDFAALKTWLNTSIHAHGKRYRAGELCQMLTGKPLSADPLLNHLQRKLDGVYGV
ncbi:MAG: carboxypeptidase M32 [Planctomycetes bacterium]|nr:carboxypeptidase M32 [Planctomycetota bacterium]